MIAFLLAFSLHAPFALAGVKEPNLKWDLEVREQSLKFQKEMYPKGNIDAWWASPDYNRKSGLLRNDSPASYRHMHAMVVAAFYAKRKDHREAARAWLARYECENTIACDDYFAFLDGALKANLLTESDPEIKKQQEGLRDEAKERQRSVGNDKPPTTGLCGPDSDRAGWLAREYELFCPARQIPAQYGLGGGTKETEALKFKLALDSSQMVLSSSYLDKLEHLGSADCSKPWKAKLICGGAEMLVGTYTLGCVRKGTKVSCTEEKRKR